MGQFDWQTDNDNEWEESPLTESRPLAWWKRVIIILVVSVFVGSTALVALRQLGLRSALTMNQAQTDVQLAHDLWRQAVSQGDAQLLAGLLDQENYPFWAEAQAQRVALGSVLFDRTAYGFYTLDDDWREGFAAATNLTIASTVSHAEVSFTQTYRVFTGLNISQTVTLEHTVAYHYQSGQWLAGPLANTTWGASRTARLPHLTLNYPERDAAIVQRLLLDWSQLVQQLCSNTPPFRCGRDYTLNVELSSAPNAMYTSLAGTEFLVTPGQRLHAFSTPTYLGLPTDEASYQALCRGYSRPLAQQILLDIQNLSRNPEIQAVFWLEQRLHELGLLVIPDVFQALPGNARPMPNDLLSPVCVPNAGRIALGGVDSE